MAFSLVTHVVGTGTSGGSTSGAIDTSGANLLVLAIAYYNQTTHNPTVSDSKSNTWISVSTAEYDDQTGDHCSVRIYYAYNPTVGSGHTFTVTAASYFGSFAVATFSGATTTDPKDVETGHTHIGSGTTEQPGSITPTANNELVISALSLANPVTGLAIDSSFIVTDTRQAVAFTYNGISIAYKIQTSATAENPTWSWTGSCSKVAAIAAFKGSGGAPPSGNLFRLPNLSLGVGGPFFSNPIG